MEITIDEFKEKYLVDLQNHYHERLTQNITSDIAKTRDIFWKNMEGFLSVIEKFQEYYAIEIGEIQISLLNISVELGNPQFAFSVYDENGMFGEEILTAKFNAGWYLEGWSEYRNSIVAKVKEIKAINYIREEAIKQMMRESIKYAVSCLAVVCKYIFLEFEKMEKYNKILWADAFILTVGSYRDWRKTIYRKTNEIDIFWSDNLKKYEFCHFNEVVYNKKSFHKIILSNAHFYGCEFVHCKFCETDFRDAIFDSCRFYHCSFDGVNVSGATIRNSTIKKCELSNMIWNEQYSKINEIYEFYKPFEMFNNIVEFCTNDGDEWKGITN